MEHLAKIGYATGFLIYLCKWWSLPPTLTVNVCHRPSQWTSDEHWKYIRHSYSVLNAAWVSYVYWRRKSFFVRNPLLVKLARPSVEKTNSHKHIRGRDLGGVINFSLFIKIPGTYTILMINLAEAKQLKSLQNKIKKTRPLPKIAFSQLLSKTNVRRTCNT